MKNGLLLIMGLALIGLTQCARPSGGIVWNGPVKLERAWATDTVLRTPESVLVDSGGQNLYVACMNTVTRDGKDGDGYIARLLPNGTVQTLFWASGLNDPKGMAIYGNVLYVADLTELVAIALSTGGIIQRYTIPGAKFMNDVTVDQLGRVYVSDSDAHKIYAFQNGRLEVWVDDTDGERPNGLLVEPGEMISALASSGEVKTLGIGRKKYKRWLSDIPSADGIARRGDGYFVSNWNGEVYYVKGKNSRRKWKVIDTKDQKINAADIDFSEVTRRLYVPTFYDNRVVAYEIR